MSCDWSIIPFGRYKTKNFKEIKDLQYLTWFIGRLNNECQIKECAEAIIIQIARLRKERTEKKENKNGI